MIPEYRLGCKFAHSGVDLSLAFDLSMNSMDRASALGIN